MVFTNISEEPRKSIFMLEGERNREGSFSLLVTSTRRHNAEYRNANTKLLPYFLLRLSRLVSSLGIIDRYSDNLQTRCYCFQHHVIFSTKACDFTVVQNLVVKKITSSPLTSGRWPTWRTVHLYNTFIATHYMFRANTCSSSGGQLY